MHVDSANNTFTSLMMISIAPAKRCIHMFFFLFLHENICCGYSFEAPRRGASNEYHNICSASASNEYHNIYFREEIRKISVLFDWIILYLELWILLITLIVEYMYVCIFMQVVANVQVLFV